MLEFPHSDEALQTSVAEAFRVVPSHVVVIRDIKDLGDAPVTCLRLPLVGKPFDTLLSFYLSLQPEDEWVAYSRLADALKSDLLVANDDDGDPFSMYRVDRAGRRHRVRVAAEPLDERNEYVIVDSEPPA